MRSHEEIAEDRAFIEAMHIDTPPVPPMTQEQQLSFALVRAAELQVRLLRVKGLMGEAVMWLSVGCGDRAQEALNKGILEL